MERNRRDILKIGLGATAAIVFGASKASRVSAAEDLKKEFLLNAQKIGGFNTLGYRLSDPWVDKNGLLPNVAYQQGLLQKNPDGQICLRNIYDDLSKMGFDADLNNNKYGVIVPPTQPISFLDLPIDILKAVDELKEKGADPGLPTSEYTDYKSFQIVRFQKMAIQRWSDGLINRILIGNAVKNMGLIPSSALLKEPQIDNLPPVDSCRTGTSWEGTASYYSRAGCLGCSSDFRMANGDIFYDNKLTLAFMRAPLNSLVRVENILNKLSVIAVVTDRGGFEPYGRIADLSQATKDAIGGMDLTPVRITEMFC